LAVADVDVDAIKVGRDRDVAITAENNLRERGIGPQE
jgi:hypothetical protein